MLTKSMVNRVVHEVMASSSHGEWISWYEDNSGDIAELIEMCEAFARAKFGVSLAELLCPTMPLVYQDLSQLANDIHIEHKIDADNLRMIQEHFSNEPDFPEAKGADVLWEKE